MIVLSKYCICCAVLCMYFLVVIKLRIYKDPALEYEDETLGSTSSSSSRSSISIATQQARH
jgi:hypothetical protein